MSKGLKVRRGSGNLTKSSVIVTAPAGSSVRVVSAGGYNRTKQVDTKNLLDIDAYNAKVGTQAVNGAVTWFEDGLWLQSTGTDCFTNYGPQFFTIPAKPNTKYTISWDLTGSEKLDGFVFAFVYNSENSEIGTYNAVNTDEKLTFTTPEGTAKFGFRFGVQTAGQNAMYSNIQIEEGEKTSYVRYNSCEFKNVPNGWCLATATKGSEKAETSQFISRKDIYYFTLKYRQTPEFTYTGSYALVQDNDQPISDFANWKGNWKIRFLTSGTLTITNMYGWDGNIDAFLVGGGGSSTAGHRVSPGGAGSGYTFTAKMVKLQVNTPYEIVVGSGANPGEGVQGGTTSAFGHKAGGGQGTNDANILGYGGSQGGGFSDGNGDNGQRNRPGPNGESGTTREFGESSGKLYAGGGGSNSNPNGGEGGGGGLNNPGQENTGGGAGGFKVDGRASKGGSGIVIIRNARAA